MELKKENRAGVGVGIITRGNVSIKWMSHMDKLKPHMPIGMFWKNIIVEGLSWAPAREEIVRKARKENFEWLFFVDDDVFIPSDAVRTMLSRGEDIVTGIYWTKSDNSCPVIFEKTGSGPMFNFPIDERFEVAGSGLGCCLINMKVFDDFDKAGIPYFKENWIMETEGKQKIKCPIGEDHYFFYHARKFGYKVIADSGILCDHYDMNQKKFYPSEEEVRRITGKKLEELGRGDVVENVNKAIGKDPKKKTISFVNFASNPFAGDELEKRGCGGAETAVINMARELAKNYNFNVHVFCKCPAPGRYDDVIYHDIETGLNALKDLNSDLLISSRNTQILTQIDFKKDYNAKQVALWTHDIPDDPVYESLEECYPSLDKVFVLTEFHKEELIKKFPFVKEEKIFIAPNGIDMRRYKDRENIEKVPGRLIYSSTPFRGLDILAEVFPRIKARVPHANLKVFSSMKVYGEGYDDNQYVSLYNMLNDTPGIDYVGTVKQDKLAEEFAKAEVLAYPNTFPETFCITATESMAGGTPIVTSNFAALKEIVTDDTGVKLEGNPHSTEYKDAFVDAVVELLTNKDKWKTLSDACLTKDYSWTKIADKWVTEFFPEQSKDQQKEENNVDSIKKAGNINTPDYWDQVYANEIGKGQVRHFEKSATNLSKFIKNGDKVLDVGCGTGEFTRHVKDNFPDCEVWGSDFSNVAIDFCRQQNRHIFYANHPILNDEFENDFFDVITINHVVEHLDKPKEMITRAKELLKLDGTLILTFPINDDEWHEHLKIWHLNDIEELLRDFNCDYNIKTQYLNRTYSDGRKFQEAIVNIKFLED